MRCQLTNQRACGVPDHEVSVNEGSVKGSIKEGKRKDE
jgi:hypothetical protein